ncbi:MAG: D-alanine--D-alanine ligase [Magnetococcales bacterium]|nr:D-alanine--D-alanine ligase [Magnetococcales bacterium]
MSVLKPHIGVLLGGNSTEREVSLKSGEALLKAYQQLGHNVTAIDTADGANLPATLLEKQIDVAILALHGPGGEDGAIQGLLETMGIPYSGSGVTASAVCMDKVLTKQILRDSDLPTPPWSEVTVEKCKIIKRQAHPQNLTPPYFIKPLNTGSSVGVMKTASDINITDNIDEFLLKSANDAAPDGTETRVLIEKEVVGTEVTLTILDKKILPIIEILPKKGFYSYDNKYTVGRTQYLIPPKELGEETLKQVGDIGLAAGQLLGCRGLYRVDFIVDAKNQPWILELNTIPGLTPTSLAPKAALAFGLSFEELASQILAGARLDICIAKQ